MQKLALLAAAVTLGAAAQTTVNVRIRTDQPGAAFSPALYGLMTEEINYSYDGGLYAELIRNRNFKEDAAHPVHWTAIEGAAMALDTATPFNAAVPASLKVSLEKATSDKVGGVSNDGFWGIPVHPNTKYKATVYAKAAPGFTGPLTVAIFGNDGKTTAASAQIPRLTGEWHKYEVTLTTGPKAAESAENHFAITSARPGTFWLGFVSLFPPTYANRANGNRPDIMKLLADMHPAFLRFPGGNYLEGNTIATRFDWKKTIGDVTLRPGHMDDAWKYWSSDGMGLLEFLNWCEDLHMQPLLAVYAGYSLKGERVRPGVELQPYVQDALDEIEYVTGGPETIWGGQRVKDGHPKPFPLEYVEVGNEDNFDRAEGGSYDARFAQFFDAIKARYPKLQVISTASSAKTRSADLIDEHLYPNSLDDMASRAHQFDNRPRGGAQKVFVGEWATRVGEPTPNMTGALGDAAWMTGMERNSDLVVMASYAPLFVNVNPGGMQWKTDLIGYDTLHSYGSPAYYAQQMFSTHHGDTILAVEAPDIPVHEWQPPTPRGRAGVPPPPPPPVRPVPSLFFSASRDSKTGTIYFKVVNPMKDAMPVHITAPGVTVAARGQSRALIATSPDDTNSIAEPTKIAPRTTPEDGLSADFTKTFPPYSITILEMKATNAR
jgi:alpha-N-arabinofuranosidase